MKKYIDIGVNLTANSFKKDTEQVVERALQAGVTQLVVTGTDTQHSEQAIQLTQQYASICYATAGLHPHHASDYCSDTGSELRDMLAHKNVLAVGECGLDFNRNFSTRKQQITAFEAQLELAIDLKMPVFLHQRDAHEDFVAIIKSCRNVLQHMVVHCFTGTSAELQDYNALDMHVGVTGWICDERRGQSLQQAAKEIPLDRVMLETDSPYLLPRDLVEKPHKKGRNEPCYLPHIVQTLATCMAVEEAQLTTVAYENSRHFFGITATEDDGRG